MTQSREPPEVEMLASEECQRGITGKRPVDRTVTKVEVVHAGKVNRFEDVFVMCIAWETVSAGFGNLRIYGDAQGELCMSPEFVKAVLAKLVDQAVESGNFG